MRTAIAGNLPSNADPVQPTGAPSPHAPRRNLTHAVLEDMFHERGRVPTDTPEMAAARREQSNIQRRHRTERRHGEDPSQTPSLDDLVRERQVDKPGNYDNPLEPDCPGQDLREAPNPFVHKPLQLGRPRIYSSPIISNPSRPPRPRGRPRKPRPEPEPRQNDGSSINLDNGNRRRCRSDGSPDSGRPRGRPRLHSPEPALQNLPLRPAERVESCPFNVAPPEFHGNAQESPLSEEDLRIKRRFDEALAAEEMTECLRCKEKWFDMKLKRDRVCMRCHTKDDKKEASGPFLYSADNKLDFITRSP
ncbi:hypothetical protein F4804DRAFT_328675 [Jackrogersella minutella]|nr:hypothetical protein F4804DRAFT_328675 [Jackrogersella minutella]